MDVILRKVDNGYRVVFTEGNTEQDMGWVAPHCVSTAEWFYSLEQMEVTYDN
jgi:hypothetical protein